MSFWDVQPGDMLKVGVPLFMKKQSSWEILLATNPQPICSQDISITSFCVEVLCPGMGRVQSDNFRVGKVKQKACRSLLPCVRGYPGPMLRTVVTEVPKNAKLTKTPKRGPV